MLVSIVVLTVVLTTIALTRMAPKLYQTVTLHVIRGNQWYSFLWAATFVASVCNIALLGGELTLVYHIKQKQMNVAFHQIF